MIFMGTPVRANAHGTLDAFDASMSPNNSRQAVGRPVLQRCRTFFFFLYILIALPARPVQSAIRISPLMEIWPPTITTNLFAPRTLPIIAANDNGALLAWVERDAAGVTNVMAVAISQDGQMTQPYGRLIGTEGLSGFAPEIYPAGDEFYVVFRQALSRAIGPGSSALVFARVDNDGRLLAPPQTIVSNVTERIISHSNGQSLLSAFVAGKGETVLELIRRDGASVRTVLPPQQGLRAVGLSSVGRTYLMVEQDSAGRLQGIVVNGYTGAVYTNVIASVPGFTPFALSSDESQYLLATRGTNNATQFFLLSGDGRVLASATTNAPALTAPKMFRYGSGWVVWGNPVFAEFYGQITAYSVTSNGDTVEVGPNPLSRMSGQTIAPFGDKGFIVGQQTLTSGMYRVGCKIVTASGESPVQFPLALSRQYLATVASSPDGYVVLWKEQGDRTDLVGVRFSNDGTRLDATPFVVLTNAVTGQVRAVYETNAYHVVWVGSVRGRLINSTGPPNVRASGAVAISNIPDLELTKFGGELIAYQRGSAGTSISHGSLSALKPSVITLAGTDERLFEANGVAGQLWAGLIGAPLETLDRTNLLGMTLDPVSVSVASLGTNFFVAWHDPQSTNVIGAIVSEDGATRTNVLFANVSPTVSLKAASSDKAALLSVTLTNNIAFTTTTNYLVLYEKTSGTYSVTSQILPIVTNTLSIASLGEDFVIATSILGEAGPVVALRFVTATEPASATISVDGGGGLTIKFDGLESTRRYRIERSTDLVNWEFLQSVTQTESLTLPVDAALAAAFYRAVLEPE